MPMISVTMFPGRTEEQKKALVEEVTAAFVRTCDGHRPDVWVVINEVPRHHWALGGKLYSEK
jgi:4-oxalocrotonate tautomerase